MLIVLAFGSFVGRLGTISPSTRVPGRRADVNVHVFGMAARRAGIFPAGERAGRRDISPRVKAPAACVLRTQAGDAR